MGYEELMLGRAQVGLGHDVWIIASNSLYPKRMAGAMSDLSAWSFCPTKVLGGYGDGGMVCTDNAELAARVERLLMYGMDGPREYSTEYGHKSSYSSEEAGYNSRLDEIQAAILLTKLPKIDRYLERRRDLAGRYGALLAGTAVVLATTAPGNIHAHHLYVCRHSRRDTIVAELAKRDIVAKVGYPWPVHAMPAHASLGYKEGDLPEAEGAARQIFSLPMYPDLPLAFQDRVCDAIHQILA